jgi:hypothetical protein
VASQAVETRELACKRVDENLAQRPAELIAKEAAIAVRVEQFREAIA